MNIRVFNIVLVVLMVMWQLSIAQKSKKMEYNKLTPQEERVLLFKATDRPFTGDYYLKKDAGTYVCRRCNAALYRSADKFEAHCGWPSFDDEIKGSVKRIPDADGMRTEIVCSNCGGHLGHVFDDGPKDTTGTRYCMNSISIKFIPAK